MKRNKYFIFFLVLCFAFSISSNFAYAAENQGKMIKDKAFIVKEYPNFPEKFLDKVTEIYNSKKLQPEYLARINDWIVEYNMNDYLIKMYLEFEDKGGEYPEHDSGSILTLNGIELPDHTEPEVEPIKVGSVIGEFKRTSEKYRVYGRDIVDGILPYNDIPVYHIDGGDEAYICVEDLEFCGYQHIWDAKNRISSFNYNGKTFKGLSAQKLQSGKIYGSDIKIIIGEGEYRAYNIGGYSLVRALDLIHQFDVEIKEIAKTAETVKVSLPHCKVMLNGQELTAIDNAYPPIVYHNVTYLPMAYNYAGFLGLKSEWYPEKKYKGTGVLFVGASGESLPELKIYPASTPNKVDTDAYTATVADYNIAVNTIFEKRFIDNKEEAHPILNFRDVTYFPLTYYFAREEFGWQYQWSAENGLEIDSRNAFRPVLPSEDITFDLPWPNITEYCYNNSYYIAYPTSTTWNTYEFTVGKKGEGEKEYSLESQLEKASDKTESGEDVVYSFAWWYYDENVRAYTPPYISGNVFYISAKRQYSDTKSDIVDIRIDLDTGKVISEKLSNY